MMCPDQTDNRGGERQGQTTRALLAVCPMTLPRSIVDCHHHFLAPSEPFHAYINALGAPVCTEFE